MRSTRTVNRRTVGRRLVVAVFLVAVVVAVAVALAGQDFSVVRTAAAGRPPAFFGLVVGCAVAASSAQLLLGMGAWRAMLLGVGAQASVTAAARIYFVGVFAKFVPGKVLGFVTSVQMGKAIGVPPSRIISAWLLTLAVLLQTGLAVGLLAAAQVVGASAGWLALAALPVLAVVVRPSLINHAASGVARLLRRPQPPAVSGRAVRRAVAAQSLSWLLAGLHFWLLAVAAGARPAGSLLLCVGAFSLATVAGLAAVITPEGLGVREVILMVALSTLLPLPSASAVVLVSRLVFTVSEIATAGVGLLVTEVLRRRSSGDEQSQTAEPVARCAVGKGGEVCPDYSASSSASS